MNEVRHRALPARYLRLMASGIDPAEMKASGRTALMRALTSTAMSAQQRGWSYLEWHQLVLEPHHHLGVQVQMKGGRRLTRETVAKTMNAAWDFAERNVGLRPAPAADAARAWALEQVDMWRESVADCPALTADQHAALQAFAEIAHRHGFVTPAAPRRELMERSGLGDSAIRTVIRQLEAANWIKVERRGQAGAMQARATTYRLISPACHALAEFDWHIKVRCSCEEVPLAAEAAVDDTAVRLRSIDAAISGLLADHPSASSELVALLRRHRELATERRPA